MKVNQLKALIDFIEAKASEVVTDEVGLEGGTEAWSHAWNAEKELYKAFGFDFFAEKDKEKSDVS